MPAESCPGGSEFQQGMYREEFVVTAFVSGCGSRCFGRPSRYQFA